MTASFDGGLVLPREAERRLGLAESLAACLRDACDPDRIHHPVAEMPSFRILAIARAGSLTAAGS